MNAGVEYKDGCNKDEYEGIHGKIVEEMKVEKKEGKWRSKRKEREKRGRR